MKYLEQVRRFLFSQEPPISVGWPTRGSVTFFVPRIRVLGHPRIYKASSLSPRPTYQIGRVIFLDDEGYCLSQRYIEQEKMNFGFWAVAGGGATEKIQHYDDSVERRGNANYFCFAGDNVPGGLPNVPLLPLYSDTSYMKEPLTIFDDLIPDDFDQALCRTSFKRIINYDVLPRPEDNCGYGPDNYWNCQGGSPESTLPSYEETDFGYGIRSFEDNGFTRYFDPRKHGNGNWARGLCVELFPDAGDVSLDIQIDTYGGM